MSIWVLSRFSIIVNEISIIELFSVKAATLIYHIWAWLGYFICSRRENRFYLFDKELISCLSCANVRAFHEIPDRYI